MGGKERVRVRGNGRIGRGSWRKENGWRTDREKWSGRRRGDGKNREKIGKKEDREKHEQTNQRKTRKWRKKRGKKRRDERQGLKGGGKRKKKYKEMRMEEMKMKMKILVRLP